jgi:hypothetical protein
MDNLEFHLSKIAEERLCFAMRLKVLLEKKGHEIEVSGYLSMINRLNKASIQLSREYTISCDQAGSLGIVP